MAMKNWYNWLVAQGFKEDMISLVEGTTKKKREKELAKNKPIIICNYEMSISFKLKRLRKWKVILYDESYRLAHIDANVTQYWIRGHRDPEQIRIALTGEPAPENPLNFATQYFIVRGGFMGYDSYMMYYLDNWRRCDYSGKDIPLVPTHDSEIRDYVRETAYCRTMKSLGLGSEILYNEFFFDLNSKQKKLMEKVKELQDASKFIDGPVAENQYKLKARSMERLVSAGLDPDDHSIINRSKIDFIVDSYLEEPEPIVVLSFYKAPLFELQRTFESKGIKCGLIYGQIGTASEKETQVDKFKDAEYDVMLGQTRSVKMNYDFSRASKTYYLTNSYSQDDRSQSEKRTTNINKATPVEIIDLSYNDTLDHAVVDKLKKKKKISYSFIDEEFEDLFSKHA